MQRRAAAVYFALFVLIAAGAYAFMQVGMAQPTAEFDAETLSQGEQLTAGGTTYTVSTVDAESEEGSTTYTVELTYTNQTSGEEETVSAGQGSNMTLSGVQHFTYFPSGDEVYVLPSEQFYDQYLEFLDTEDHYQERKAGFWGVIYISFITGLVLLMTAFLPVKG
jgi:hypothetical protein